MHLMRCIRFVGSKMPIFFKKKFFYINSFAFGVCSIRANKRTMQRMPYNKQQNTKHEREEKKHLKREKKARALVRSRNATELSASRVGSWIILRSHFQISYFMCVTSLVVLLKNCGVRILLKYTHSNLVQLYIAPNWTFIAPKTIFLYRNYVN